MCFDSLRCKWKLFKKKHFCFSVAVVYMLNISFPNKRSLVLLCQDLFSVSVLMRFYLN